MGVMGGIFFLPLPTTAYFELKFSRTLAPVTIKSQSLPRATRRETLYEAGHWLQVLNLIPLFLGINIIISSPEIHEIAYQTISKPRQIIIYREVNYTNSFQYINAENTRLLFIINKIHIKDQTKCLHMQQVWLLIYYNMVITTYWL